MLEGRFRCALPLRTQNLPPMTPEVFLDAVFEDRFRFSIPPGTKIPMTLYTGVLRKCHYCKTTVRMVTHMKGCTRT